MSTQQDTARNETQYIPGSAQAIKGYCMILTGVERVVTVAYASEPSERPDFNDPLNFAAADYIFGKAEIAEGFHDMQVGIQMWLEAARRERSALTAGDIIRIIENEVYSRGAQARSNSSAN